jgi:hypothetical protein
MTPSVPQPAGLVEPAAAPRPAAFAYSQLLAFYRGEVADPYLYMEIEDRVRKDPRWRAHWESVRYLDLERAAALQDAADLERFGRGEATGFCRHVAETGGRVFDTLLEGVKTAGGWTAKEWTRHLSRCVYCRRMQRRAQARRQRREAGLPASELLLRDWLLLPCYAGALNEATRRLGFEPLPMEALPALGDTVVGLDTVLAPPRRSASDCSSG